MDSDRIEGNLKEAEGKLNGDEALEQEGQAQDSWGKAKDSADDAYESAKDLGDDAWESAKDAADAVKDRSTRRSRPHSPCSGSGSARSPRIGEGRSKKNPASAPAVAIQSVATQSDPAPERAADEGAERPHAVVHDHVRAGDARAEPIRDRSRPRSRRR